VEYFNYLGSTITNDARCICEIKSRIATTQQAFNMNNTLFTSKLGVHLKKKLVHAALGVQLCTVLNLNTSKSR
jgi:hypothetical protein